MGPLKPSDRIAARRDFGLLFVVMLTTAAGNTALQSVLPALGRSLRIPDYAIALTFSFSALVWALSAPMWARRSDRRGRRRMVIMGMAGFTISVLLCGVALSAGINGWLSPLWAFVWVIVARMIYGFFGSAAPPAAQALVASRTSRGERTNALTMLASAFGLGTIIGPALAPFFVLPFVGLAGPAYAYTLIGAAVLIFVYRRLPDDLEGPARGAAASEPSIGGEPSGANVIAAINEQTEVRLKLTDARLLPWVVAGVISGHAQAISGQVLAFLIIDRLALQPLAAQPIIGLVLMSGAGAALLAQWGIIPRLGLPPRALILWGSLIAGVGCAGIALAQNMHSIAVAFAIASLGFGLTRPGFTAGASLAVGTREQGAVAGTITSINGAVFVLGPAIGIGLYQIAAPLPFLATAAALIALSFYAMRALRPSSRGA
jgi:MFS family permease